jgi:hypothetical protein
MFNLCCYVYFVQKRQKNIRFLFLLQYVFVLFSERTFEQ